MDEIEIEVTKAMGELQAAFQLRDWKYAVQLWVGDEKFDELAACSLAMIYLVYNGEAGRWDVHIDNVLSDIYQNTAQLVTDLSCAELCLLVNTLAMIIKEQNP